MDPFSIAGLGLEALGVGASTINWIKKIASKKLRIIPHEIQATSKHWLSTYIVVQNKSEDPLFDVQIVCWLESEQEIRIKPKHVPQKQDIGKTNVEIDTAFYLIHGNVEGRPVKLLEFSRILPKESFEIEVQIHRKGTVKFIPTRFNEDKPKMIQQVDNGITIPFTPPFEMQMEGTAFWMNIKNNSEK